MASEIRIQAPAAILEASRALQTANRARLESRQQDRWAERNATRVARDGLRFAESKISKAAGRLDPWRGAVPEFEPVRQSFARIRGQYIISRTFYTITASVINDSVSIFLDMKTNLQFGRPKKDGEFIVQKEIILYTGTASLTLNGVAEAFNQQLSLPTSAGVKYGGVSSFEVNIFCSFEVVNNMQKLKYVSPIPSVVIGIRGSSSWFTVTSALTDPVTGNQLVFSKGSVQSLNPVTTTTGVSNSGTAWLTEYINRSTTLPPSPPSSTVIEFVQAFSLLSGLFSPGTQTVKRQTLITIKEPNYKFQGNP